MSPLGQKRWFDRRLITSGLPPLTDILRVNRHVSNVPIPDLPNATAHCAKRTIANSPAIAFIAGHAIERAARLLRNCRLVDVPAADHESAAGSGRSMQKR